MKVYSVCSFFSQSKVGRLKLFVGALTVASLVLWSSILFKKFPAGSLYSSGTTFAADGVEINFTDQVLFKQSRVKYTIKMRWNGKSNIMQETGRMSYGLLGQLLLSLDDTRSVGPSLLSEFELEDDLAFTRLYVSSGKAVLNAVPVSGDFEGLCFYIIYLNKVHCGSLMAASSPITPDSSSQ